LPIAVLISGSTASASEIVAAALQDSDRAVVIGTNSFGKGTVQEVHPMPNGAELILTVARFYAPSGYTLQHLGVLPTICTSRRQEDATALLAELAADKMPRLPIERRNRVSPDDAAGLEQLKAECPASPAIDSVDLDLASRLLENPGLFAKAIALADPGTKTLQ
jgi:carboxyl-terminal processing protease